MRLLLIVLLAGVGLAPIAAAQHHGHAGATDDTDRMAAGRPAALSADVAAGLLEGRGMGLAEAADANGYPGPLHVLQRADALGLSAAQRGEAERIRAAMLANAVPLGEQILTVERHLDALFASGEATHEAVERMTAHAAALRGRLRAVHLRAHVDLRDVLTPDQAARYGDTRDRH